MKYQFLRNVFFFAGLISSSIALSAPTKAPTTAEAIKILKAESGTVDFLAVGKPSFLKVNGTGATPSGTLRIHGGKASGEFSVDLNSFDTKNSTRNEHMKEKYLETGKPEFAKAIVTFNDFSLPENGPIKAEIPAELSLHGQKKPITLKAELGEGEKRNATGTFSFKLTDFGIEIPSYGGVTIADEVTVRIEAVLQ